MGSPLVSYTGFLRFPRLTSEGLQEAKTAIAGSGLELDLEQGWLELEYSGRDTNENITRLLLKLAGIIGDAEGEVTRTFDSGDGCPQLEYYSIHNGKLYRQRGWIVRDEPCIVE